MIISTSKIMEALTYYSNLGYVPIDVPYCVDRSVSELTKPMCKRDTEYLNDKVYVGSAEQSFIQMYMDGKLPDGKYMALTPCVRDDEHDDLHHSVFMKLELFDCGDKTQPFQLGFAMQDFFEQYIKTTVVAGDDRPFSTDILDKKLRIELGSYGMGILPGGKFYSYGTGIAEPRLSTVIRKVNEL